MKEAKLWKDKNNVVGRGLIMKIIKDIRLYKSKEPNTDGNSLPSEFADKKLNITINRIVMKLREAGFSLGDFDHLYLNFTACPVSGGSALAKRSVDTYHPWYRYYDVEVSGREYDTLGDDFDIIISLLRTVLCRHFATEDMNGEKINVCISEAVLQGENMLMHYKEKKTKSRRAVLYLRLQDNGKYRPLLRVWDMDGNKLLEKDLSEMLMLESLGEIRLSGSKVSVLPKKNSFSGDLAPIEFAY